MLKFKIKVNIKTWLPCGYNPLGFSGHDLAKWPISWQIKHFANGKAPGIETAYKIIHTLESSIIDG